MEEQKLIIRPLRMNDYLQVLGWSKDEAFCIANGWDINRVESELYEWWQGCVNRKSEDFIRLGIEWNDQLIGYGDLASINGNSAEIGIAIGDSSKWGKGIGRQATKLLIAYAYEKLAISVFDAETHASNIRSRKMLEKIGFKEISRVGSEMYQGETTELIQYRLYV